MREHVILVDEQNRELGEMEKLQAHREGALHRAFSVFVFHPDGRLLLQRRARTKYHSGGLWSNTCCGHPRPGETVAAAARRRLAEEVGFSCELREISVFRYRADVGGGLVEHEVDHVFLGSFDGAARPAEEEVEEVRWESVETVEQERSHSPERFTLWFPHAWEVVLPVARP